MTTPGYPPPDDLDDEIGQRFLDQLRADLADAGGYGTREWRAARDAQIHRLRSLGWTNRDLTEHYRISRATLLASLARAADAPEPTWDYELRFRATRADLGAIQAVLNERGISHTTNGRGR